MAEFYSGLSVDDVWAGRIRAGHVLVLAEQLKMNPHSRVRALWLGDIRFKGWTAEATILADQFDQFDQIIHIVSGFGGKDTVHEDSLYPRPKSTHAAPVEEEPVVPTIAEFSVPAMMRAVYA